MLFDLYKYNKFKKRILTIFSLKIFKNEEIRKLIF